MKVGNITLTVLETPGHTRDHISYLMEEEGCKSLFGIDRLYPGHGTMLLTDAHQCIREAHDIFAALAIPPNL